MRKHKIWAQNELCRFQFPDLNPFKLVVAIGYHEVIVGSVMQMCNLLTLSAVDNRGLVWGKFRQNKHYLADKYWIANIILP